MSTITSEFTTEQLIEHLRTRIEHRSGLIANMHIDRGYRDYLKLELRSSEIALASLEAEPVALEWTNKQCLEFLSIAFRHAEIKGDLEMDDIRLGVKMVNGSCAAMLQGADGNSPVVPDGWVACSERMPKKGQEVLCTDQFDNYETALYDTGYIPGPPFFATTAGEFHPTHWMPLPTPPLK